MARLISFAYPGGKARLARRICALLPQSGHRFVDPFGGRGNVTWAVMQLLNYEQFWLNDIERFPFYAALSQSWLLAIHPKRDGATYRKKKAEAQDRKRGWKAHAMLHEPFLTYSGSTYDVAGPSSEKGGGARLKGFTRNVRMAQKLIEHNKPRLTRLDYLKVLDECGKDDVVFLDPPYLGADVRAYTDKSLDHATMVKRLLKADFRWMLTEYEHPLYTALGEPIRIPVQKVMHNANHTGGKRQTVTECIWKNF